MEQYLIPLKTPCVYYDASFISPTEADEAFDDLLKNTPWEKSPKINRWVTLMELPPEGDANSTTADYKYRDAPGKAIQGFPPAVMKLKTLAEEWYNTKRLSGEHCSQDAKFEPVSFNICLLNYYPTSSHRLGWHSDREELGRSTPIASISLGCPRTFLVRSKTDGMRDRNSIRMTNGSMVVMENICQMKYLHSVPKEDADEPLDGDGMDVGRGRINLTFRCKDYDAGTTAGELEHEKRDNWIDSIQKEGGDADVMASGWKIPNSELNCEEDLVFGDGIKYYDAELHSEMTVEYVVRTNIGSECYCAAELEELIDIEKYQLLARPFGVAGYVAVARSGPDTSDDNDKSELESMFLRLRTAHHILRYHDHFDLENVAVFNSTDKASIDGEMLYQFYEDRLVTKVGCVPSLAELETGTFRVSSERIGNHGFQAPEVER